MEKPKKHPELPKSTAFIKLPEGSDEYRDIAKSVKHSDFKIESISRIVSQEQWAKYRSQKSKLHKKIGKKPSERFFYHLTRCSSAKKIAKVGFNIKLSRLCAFGKGINLCTDFKNVLKYQRMYIDSNNRSALILTQGLVGKAHANSSDDNTIIRNNDGSSYTKPQRMLPRKGFDSMYSKSPSREIWIIPSSQRVYPSYLIIIKKLKES